MTLDAPSVLLRLIATAERMLHRSGALEPDFEELAAIVNEPGSGLVGLGDESRMLVMALRKVQIGTSRTEWSMIAGALLPMVRAALYRTLEQRHSTLLQGER